MWKANIPYNPTKTLIASASVLFSLSGLFSSLSSVLKEQNLKVRHKRILKSAAVSQKKLKKIKRRTPPTLAMQSVAKTSQTGKEILPCLFGLISNG
jgi:hypothetical protein